MIELENREKLNFFSFFEDEDDAGRTNLQCFEMDSAIMGEYVTEEGSEMGHKYQIVLVKDHQTDPDKFDKLDLFEAILTDPVTYIRQMIGWGWYGVVVRKSTKSQELVDLAIDNIKKVL
jgi:hypothetical protein